MTQTFKFLAQIALLALIYAAAKYFVELTGLPIPANVLGIVILFTLLASGIIKERHVSDAAGFLLKHLVFFFIPIAVGLMTWGEVFYDYGLVLLAAIVISSFLPLLTVGYLVQYLQKGDKSCKK
jgi:Putative effector of murein hydrolase LrgA